MPTYRISRGQCSSFYTSIETHLAVGMIMLAKVSARSNRSEALQAKKLTIYCICEIFAGKKFGQPQLPLYCRKFLWKSFHECGEGRHVLFAIINTGQKISMITFLTTRAGGEIGKNFFKGFLQHFAMNLG